MGMPDRLRWWHALAISLIVGMLVGLGIFHSRPGSYSATASLLLNDQPDVLGALIGTTAAPAAEVDQGQQDRLWAILTSKMMQMRMAERFKLPSRFGISLTDAAEELGYMTKVEPMGGGLSITVKCRGYRNPSIAMLTPLSMEDARRLCAELANAYIEELDAYLQELAVEHAGGNYNFVEKAKTGLEQELTDAEQRLEELQTQYELLDPDEKALRIVDRVKAAEQAYAEAAAAVEEAAGSLSSARAQLRGVDALRVSQVVEQRNPVISQLEAKLAQLQTDVATEMARGKTAQNRDVAQIQVAIEDVERQLTALQQEVRKEFAESANPAYDNLIQTVAELQISHSGAVARKAKYAAMLSEARGALAELPPVAREYATLKRQQDAQSTLAADLTKSLAMAAIEQQRATATKTFVVLDRAHPPRWRVGPPTVLIGSIAFAISFAVLAFLMIDRRALGMF